LTCTLSKVRLLYRVQLELSSEPIESFFIVRYTLNDWLADVGGLAGSYLAIFAVVASRSSEINASRSILDKLFFVRRSSNDKGEKRKYMDELASDNKDEKRSKK
jgi:hypothetical protein